MTDDTADHQPRVEIQRSLAAPIDLVWQMWTDAEHFKSWYGPEGATIPVAEIDARVGGRRHVCMEMGTPDGPMQMWFTGEHLVVSEPSRLAYTESMSDADGNVATDVPDGHPRTTEVRVALSVEGEGTALTLTHVGVPAGSPGAMGWNMALDKLEALLAG